MKPSLSILALAGLAAAAGGCSQPSEAAADHDPTAVAAASAGKTRNLEAGVPPMCYTKTGGTSNPCWVCHTAGAGQNHLTDWDLQLEYAFSDAALTNHWTNLFEDRSAFIEQTSDKQILEHVRGDNYEPLRRALHARARDRKYPGFVPDLDFSRGVDEQGFARDGSGWRAVRFHPLAGTFWPTNGSTDDVFIRLPEPFRSDGDGSPSLPVYRLNLALVEAAIASDPTARDVDREVEPVDERLVRFDLDGDGRIADGATRVRRLPPRYAGGAAGTDVLRDLYPRGTEFLHSVRYIDPDAPNQTARRMKELRYMRKVELHRGWGLLRAYEREADEKDEGLLPRHRGSPDVGLLNPFGWRLQGFIEDREGRLRLQTEEEHRFCMGCHSALGVTADQTFSLARKVPGAAGWAYQDLRGLRDRPQVGHRDPEVLTYFRRVQGGDEIRANTELMARFFPGGVLDELAVRRAAAGGDRDLAWLLSPSRPRALALGKAYLAIVREQSYTAGRDPTLTPALNVHRVIEGNGSTELGATRHIFRDGRLHLVWP